MADLQHQNMNHHEIHLASQCQNIVADGLTLADHDQKKIGGGLKKEDHRQQIVGRGLQIEDHHHEKYEGGLPFTDHLQSFFQREGLKALQKQSLNGGQVSSGSDVVTPPCGDPKAPEPPAPA